MGDTVVVKFDLSTSEIEQLVGPSTGRMKGFVYAAVLTVVGIGVIAAGGAVGVLGLIVFGALVLFAGLITFPITVNSTRMRSNPGRLAGPTSASFSAEGMRYAGPSVAQRVDWPTVLAFHERATVWVVQARSGFFIIPKSAATADQAKQIAGLATAGIGRKYLALKS